MNLNSFIFENTMQTLKDYIMLEISKLTDEKILAEIKSIILSHNMDSKSIEDYFSKRHLDNCYKLILSKFNSHGDVEKLQELITNNGSDIDSTKFLNASNKNIYTVFQNVCNKDTISSLYELNLPSKNNIARGKLEVLLNTVLSDIDPAGHGDVPTVGSGVIEVKGSGGMIKGQVSYNIAACAIKFNEIFSRKDKDIFEKQKTLNNLLNELRESWSDEDILKGIIECYLAKYPSEDEVIKNQFQQYVLDNQSKIFLKSKVDSKVLWDAFLVTDFKFYQLLDKWDNLIVFNESGKYSAINAEKEIKMPYESVLNTLNVNGIKRITSSVKINDGRYQAIKIKKL